MSRSERLRARVEAAVDEAAGVTGPAAVHRAALDVVLEHLPAERAEALIDAVVARMRAPVEPGLLAAVDGPLLDDDVVRAVGWAPGEPWLALRARSRLGGAWPLVGLTGPGAAALAARVAAGATTIGRVALAPALLHDLCRGPARDQALGWPAWTMEEAAVTHVHRCVVRAHVLPETLGGALAGYRSFGMLGTWLAAWLGEDAARSVALASAAPHDGWGPGVGAALAVADLQAWLAAGGTQLGPAWSDPFAWLKLLSAAVHGGPLDGMLRPLRGRPADLALAEATPDLLAAASALRWDQLGAWVTPMDSAAVEGALAYAVDAMFAEDVSREVLYAAPSDPPGGRLTLDVEACTLEAAPRAHHQYTEPARQLVPPAWCADLARRGLRRVEILGARWETRAEVLAALLNLSDGPAAASPVVRVGPDAPSAPSAAVFTRVVGPPPPRVHRSAAAWQLRPADGVLPVGGALVEGLAAELAAAGFVVGPSPLGVVEDPLAAARGLRLLVAQEPLPRDVVVPADGGRWGGRWHGPELTWADRPTAWAALNRRLERAQAAVRRRPLVLLGWGTAWVDGRLLEVDEVVAETSAALDEVASWLGAPRVLLVVDPAGAPALPAEDAAAGAAVLLLAARRLAERADVETLPTYLDRGATALLESAWLAPDARAWVAAARAGGDLSAHPLLAALPAAPEPEVAPVVVADGAWPAPLREATQPGAWISGEALAAWVEAVQAALDVRPAGVDASVLEALLDKLDELEDPDAVGPIAARVLEEWLPTGAWDDAEAARWLAVALQRRWVDAVVGWVPEARRAALGEALAATGRRPRAGAPLRTPWERAVVGLVGE